MSLSPQKAHVAVSILGVKGHTGRYKPSHFPQSKQLTFHNSAHICIQEQKGSPDFIVGELSGRQYKKKPPPPPKKKKKKNDWLSSMVQQIMMQYPGTWNVLSHVTKNIDSNIISFGNSYFCDGVVNIYILVHRHWI